MSLLARQLLVLACPSGGAYSSLRSPSSVRFPRLRFRHARRATRSDAVHVHAVAIHAITVHPTIKAVAVAHRRVVVASSTSSSSASRPSATPLSVAAFFLPPPSDGEVAPLPAARPAAGAGEPNACKSPDSGKSSRGPRLAASAAGLGGRFTLCALQLSCLWRRLSAAFPPRSCLPGLFFLGSPLSGFGGFSGSASAAAHPPR